ncbi:GGDEF domain-containing protein [Amycolatopsis carbonis]|uniref:GGDEF domain-containing protein n=1 Tax=Amycolatopsis carbonis TaxID=715471 RepID=A0A9Y2N2H6_9PSEU|nr:GGDEF domain-containing protein [Amycolatopsis sp. 2-15]WIX83994.1 GGDEF domain-containing protein [Amycolatopsis sp. 2-15]
MRLLADRIAERETTLLLLDVDFFKQANTNLEHVGGDQVLAQLADVVQSISREHDMTCRWGGEEFVILMPATGQDEGVVIAERIREAFGTSSVEIEDPAGGRPRVINKQRQMGAGFTVSIGVAVSPKHGVELSELKQRADLALEWAKRNGRNRVGVASDGGRRR